MAQEPINLFVHESNEDFTPSIFHNSLNGVKRCMGEPKRVNEDKARRESRILLVDSIEDFFHVTIEYAVERMDAKIRRQSGFDSLDCLDEMVEPLFVFFDECKDNFRFRFRAVVTCSLERD